MKARDKVYATVNVNALDAAESFTLGPVAVSYEGESEAQRVARREANWTPVISFVQGDA
jgi:hypothetical protein